MISDWNIKHYLLVINRRTWGEKKDPYKDKKKSTNRQTYLELCHGFFSPINQILTLITGPLFL